MSGERWNHSKEKKDIRDLGLRARVELGAMGETIRATQIFDWLYHKGVSDFAAFAGLSKDLREKLAARFRIGALEVADRRNYGDGTTKFLFRLHDGAFIETVLVPGRKRRTGLPLDPGRLQIRLRLLRQRPPWLQSEFGLVRDHRPGPLSPARLARPDELRLHGHGRAPRQLGKRRKGPPHHEHHAEGLGIAARRMTVSTTGYLPAFKRLEALDLQVNLSLSLHAVTNSYRDDCMPIDRRFPLEDVVRAAEEYIRSGGRMITLDDDQFPPGARKRSWPEPICP